MEAPKKGKRKKAKRKKKQSMEDGDFHEDRTGGGSLSTRLGFAWAAVEHEIHLIFPFSQPHFSYHRTQ